MVLHLHSAACPFREEYADQEPDLGQSLPKKEAPKWDRTSEWARPVLGAWVKNQLCGP